MGIGHDRDEGGKEARRERDGERERGRGRRENVTEDGLTVSERRGKIVEEAAK
jgi:hypothetical protein